MTKLNVSLIMIFFLLLITTIVNAEIISKNYPNGKPFEIYTTKSQQGKAEIKEGKYESWYLSGQKKCLANFINDTISGTLKGWFSNGNLFFELKNDSIIFYNLDKKIIQIGRFDRGRAFAISDWFESGFKLLHCDKNKIEDEDPLFIVTKNNAPVYEQLSPTAPIICQLYQGDTLNLLTLSDFYALISISDSLRGYLSREYFDTIRRK